MKRALSVLLLLCMFVSLLPAAAFAVEDAQTDAQVVTEATVTEEAAVAEAEAAAAPNRHPEADRGRTGTGDFPGF